MVEKEKEKDKDKKDKMVSVKQLSKLRLGRESLEKWINEKDFEEIIQGCFVRVLLGEKEGKKVYRIALIKGVETSDAVYKVGDSLTTKLVVLNWGNAHKAFKMDFISNGNFTADEYKEWLDHMQKCNLPPVTAKDVDNKIKHIRSFVARKRLQGQGQDATAPVQAQQPQSGANQAVAEQSGDDQVESLSAPPAKRQKVQATGINKDKELHIDDKETRPSSVFSEYYAALEAAKKYYQAVKSHFDEQSEYLLDLESAQSRYIDFLRQTQEKVDQFAKELEQKRRDAGQPLDDISNLERESEKELMETQKRYDEELETMRKEVRKREKMLQDRENDIADVQKQLQKAKTLAETERASLRDHVSRKDQQLKDVQKQHNDALEKLHSAHLASQDQQQVISLQDHTMQELETQLHTEHAQAIVTQQKRRKQALMVKQRLAEYQRLKSEEFELQEMIKQLIDPSYVPKIPVRKEIAEEEEGDVQGTAVAPEKNNDVDMAQDASPAPQEMTEVKQEREASPPSEGFSPFPDHEEASLSPAEESPRPAEEFAAQQLQDEAAMQKGDESPASETPLGHDHTADADSLDAAPQEENAGMTESMAEDLDLMDQIKEKDLEQDAQDEAPGALEQGSPSRSPSLDEADELAAGLEDEGDHQKEPLPNEPIEQMSTDPAAEPGSPSGDMAMGDALDGD